MHRDWPYMGSFLETKNNNGLKEALKLYGEQ